MFSATRKHFSAWQITPTALSWKTGLWGRNYLCWFRPQDPSLSIKKNWKTREENCNMSKPMLMILESCVKSGNRSHTNKLKFLKIIKKIWSNLWILSIQLCSITISGYSWCHLSHIHSAQTPQKYGLVHTQQRLYIHGYFLLSATFIHDCDMLLLLKALHTSFIDSFVSVVHTLKCGNCRKFLLCYRLLICSKALANKTVR